MDAHWEAELWHSDGAHPLVFVTVPPEVAAEVADAGDRAPIRISFLDVG